MQQYFYTGSLELNQEVALSSDDAHHILRVMRSRMGTQVRLVDSFERLFVAELSDIVDNEPVFKIIASLNSQSELPINVTIACGLSKNDKLDWIVQKSTELGMKQFIPLALERDVVKWNSNKSSKKIERLQKIAKEAAEQSGRLMIPQIADLTTLQELVQQSFNHCWIAYEEVAKEGTHQHLRQYINQVHTGDDIIIIFGSEGGLASREAEYLMQHDYQSLSLGPRILRAETAPLYLLSVLSYETEL